MKFLICSDSHGRPGGIRRAAALHPDADFLLFLGDGLRDAESVAAEFPGMAFLAVRGNCDSPFAGILRQSEYRSEEILSLMGHRILLTHGHLYGAKSGVGGLLSVAKRQDADVVLFGHTHAPHDEYIPEGEKNIRLFNPGSISLPDRGSPSYGLLTMDKNNLLFSHGELA